MAVYSIDNQSPVDKAFRTDAGHAIIAAGASGTVETVEDLTDGQLAALRADNVTVNEGKKGAISLKAEHHGGGRFRITEGEKVLMSDLSKADADTFNALSDEEKAEFVKAKA